MPDITAPDKRRLSRILLYKVTLQEELEEEYPLGDGAIQDLKDLQELWELTDEEVLLAIEEVLHNWFYKEEDQ